MNERGKTLIFKVIDGCATPEEKEELEHMAQAEPMIREELELQEEAAAAVGSFGLRELQDDLSDAYLSGVVNRLERQGGWALFIIGLVMVTCYSIYEVLTEPTIHTVYRIGIAALIAGTGLLFTSIWRLRLKVRRHDKYTEVIR